MKVHTEIEDTRLRELHQLAYDLKYIKEVKVNHGFTPPLTYAVSDELMGEMISLTRHLDQALDEKQVDLECKVSEILVEMGHTKEQVEILVPILQDSFYRFLYKQKELVGN